MIFYINVFHAHLFQQRPSSVSDHITVIKESGTAHQNSVMFDYRECEAYQ